MKNLFLLLIIFSAVFAENRKEQEALDILAPVHKEFMEMVKNNRHMQALKHYDKNIINMAPFRPPIQGIQEMREMTKKAIDEGVEYHSISSEVLDIWKCNDMIYERGTLAFTQSTYAHPKHEAYYGSYFTIWKKQNNGTWKMRYTIMNLDFNPFE